MVTYSNCETLATEDSYEDLAHFERIRPQREGTMPAGKSKSANRGRHRDRMPKRSHRTPQHTGSISRRRRRKW